MYLAAVHHSDEGSQYTSLAVGKRCREMRVFPLTGLADDCFDNAMAESFFDTLAVRSHPPDQAFPDAFRIGEPEVKKYRLGYLPTGRG